MDARKGYTGKVLVAGATGTIWTIELVEEGSNAAIFDFIITPIAMKSG